MKFYLYLLLSLISLSCAKQERSQALDKSPLPQVLNIYPTADTLPENLLRLYVQFSQPMKAVNNLEHIKLLDDEGQEVKGAIFNNVYELWDSEQQQLTLILDPSRVKTGLVAHNNLGRALVPNKHFQLRIEKAEDIYGHPLQASYTKDLYVTEVDQEMPDVQNWIISAPPANSQAPLSITFPQPLDRLSLYHHLQLLHENGAVVAGKVEISQQERLWQFHPKAPWPKGHYTLAVNSRLEDPAGNNLNGLFDHQLGSLKSEREGEILRMEIKIE